MALLHCSLKFQVKQSWWTLFSLQPGMVIKNMTTTGNDYKLPVRSAATAAVAAAADAALQPALCTPMAL